MPRIITVLLGLVFALVALAGCEAIVGDYEVRSCEPDVPQSCADLGDADAQFVGCCDANAETVYFCEGGQLESRACGELTCDFNPDIDAMGCVE